MTAPWRGALGARSFACRSRSVALARAAASSVSSRGRFGADPSENLLCRLGFPRALAAGDRASREKPLFLLRGGPRGGGEKPVPLLIWYSLWRACLRRSYRVPLQVTCVMYYTTTACIPASVRLKIWPAALGELASCKTLASEKHSGRGARQTTRTAAF